jgi:hypothetical protein
MFANAPYASPRRFWRSVSLLAVVVACTGTESRLPTDTPPDTTGGGVQRAVLHVEVRASESDPVATALGWSEGAVPAAAVTVVRSGSSGSLTGVTNAAGRATFPDLLPGTYLVAAVRVMTARKEAGTGGT